MKALRFWKMTALVVAAVVVAACGSSRGLGRKSGKLRDEAALAGTTAIQQADTLTKGDFLLKVSDNAQVNRFITSKVKFSVNMGNREMTLTGNLKMKRDDVIRLQLMAFGFVEAARLEFTPDYALIVDRINKQYLKVPYAQLEFFRHSDIDFHLLQALFWNELFQPGRSRLTERNLKKFDMSADIDNQNIIAMDSERLSYRWLTDKTTGRINMANILYVDHVSGNYTLNWDYSDFRLSNRKMFPTHHKVTFTTPDKEVKLNMTLNYIGNDEDWETRTQLSGKYRQVTVDELLRRFMSL